MKRPLLLDLFCGAGGAAMGYYNAGFRVIGVDVNPMPRYPFEFHQYDAFDFLEAYGHGFDAIHASPPCQHYSDLAHRNGNADDWPDLLSDVRIALASAGRPYVIENVEGAPLSNPIWLCGVQFPGLRVIRHRGFESNFSIPSLPHEKHPLVYPRDKRKS
ncbi:MAG: DNA cytosine methyltransferase, partial [Candidatus Binatia bacterium]